jgi:hypothetical protein
MIDCATGGEIINLNLNHRTIKEQQHTTAMQLTATATTTATTTATAIAMQLATATQLQQQLQLQQQRQRRRQQQKQCNSNSNTIATTIPSSFTLSLKMTSNSNQQQTAYSLDDFSLEIKILVISHLDNPSSLARSQIDENLFLDEYENAHRLSAVAQAVLLNNNLINIWKNSGCNIIEDLNNWIVKEVLKILKSRGANEMLVANQLSHLASLGFDLNQGLITITDSLLMFESDIRSCGGVVTALRKSWL